MQEYLDFHFSKLCLHISIELFHFILHIYVVLNHKVIIPVIKKYFDKNVLFLTYFIIIFRINSSNGHCFEFHDIKMSLL